MSGGRDAPRPAAEVPDTPQAPAAATGNSRKMPPEVDSQALLQGRNTLLIHHQGEVYRLQQTRQGKLILTK